MPTLSASSVLAVLPAALSFTLLGAVESLLSAKVADGMTGRKHRYNMEVVAQGIANVASAIFGGISVTGTIARTATNIRRRGEPGLRHGSAGAIFMVIASAGKLYPLSALAGVLVVGGKATLPASRLAWRQCIDGFGLTLIEDLTVGQLPAACWRRCSRPSTASGSGAPVPEYPDHQDTVRSDRVLRHGSGPGLSMFDRFTEVLAERAARNGASEVVLIAYGCRVAAIKVMPSTV
jgi:hypothetical protein